MLDYEFQHNFWCIFILISEFHQLYNRNGLAENIIQDFQKIIYTHFKQYGRKFPFRENITPYNVLISEIMLQQTQTNRVSEKYLEFVNRFPNFEVLSNASLEDVLKVWQGLGYNRRAIALKKIAEIVINDYAGNLPDSFEILKSFPQIGHNTASSILAFAFNKPTIFIETNIRRVYLYFFFSQQERVDDQEIFPIVEKTLDKTNPRNWYYALMDYGVMLKKKFPDLNKKSSKYRKQSQFVGSDRQIRGKLIKLILKEKRLQKSVLGKKLRIQQKKLDQIITQLEKEGFIQIDNDFILVG